MPYPQQIFPSKSISALLNYINNFWVTNGVGDITAINGNDVVNALAQYITQAIPNYNKATIVSIGGSVTINSAVTVIITNTPTSLTWSDDGWYRNYLIINSTSNIINLASGTVYYDNFLTPQTTIPANTAINIYLSSNDLWIGAVLASSGGSGANTAAVQGKFNTSDSPSPSQGSIGGSTITINDTNIIKNSFNIYLSGLRCVEGGLNAYDYSINYSTVGVVLTTNQPLIDHLDFSYEYLKGSSQVTPSTSLVGTIIKVTKSMLIGLTYVNNSLKNYYLQVFYNDLSRYLNETTEWNYYASGGIVLSSAFSSLSDFTLYISVTGIVTS